MTKQEVKDEGKETEGDPLIKGKIRSVQRQVAMKRMMAAVPAADVVGNQSYTYAVALEYEKHGNEGAHGSCKGAGTCSKAHQRHCKEA